MPVLGAWFPRRLSADPRPVRRHDGPFWNRTPINRPIPAACGRHRCRCWRLARPTTWMEMRDIASPDRLAGWVPVHRNPAALIVGRDQCGRRGPGGATGPPGRPGPRRPGARPPRNKEVGKQSHGPQDGAVAVCPGTGRSWCWPRVPRPACPSGPRPAAKYWIALGSIAKVEPPEEPRRVGLSRRRYPRRAGRQVDRQGR